MHVSVAEAEYAQSLVQSAQALSRAKEPEQDAFAEEEDQAVENTAYYQSRQLIFDMLSTLEEQEKTVVSLRYGLETGNALTAQQVAQRLGISPEQVMTIEADALAKMRNN
jgi:RNA polymerase sigma factor (sigma-70 family)